MTWILVSSFMFSHAGLNFKIHNFVIFTVPLLFGGSFVGLWRCVTKLSLKAKFLNLCKIAQAFFLFSVSLE